MLIEIVDGPIRAESIVAAMKAGSDGAVCVFDGIVRDNTRGRKTLHLDYEAYREMALQQMERAGRRRRSEKFGVRDVALVHRHGTAAGDWRDERADRGGFGAPGSGVRCVPLAD